MSDPLVVVVPAAADGERLDRVLALETGRSRSEIAEIIAAGAVAVDGVGETRRSRRLVTGEEVHVDLVPPADDRLVADAAVEVRVAFVDDHVVVVDKSVGQVVHPGSGHRTGTLAHGLLAAFPDIAEVGDPMRPGIVHRLDRGTSGLMVVARTPEAHRALTAALAERRVGREYRVVVAGVPEAETGRIDAPIGRSPREPTAMAVRSDGREAITEYEVLEELPAGPAALLGCRLQTGRTHQIRVHLRAIDLPVLGDVRYGRLDHGAQRPMLHAWRLRFEHPLRGDPIEVTSPDPDDLSQLLKRLRRR